MIQNRFIHSAIPFGMAEYIEIWKDIMLVKATKVILLVLMITIASSYLFSQVRTNKPVISIPCSIYDSPILLNENIKIVNLGSKINSADDDYCPSVTIDGKSLIFTSNREGGKIYREETKLLGSEFIVIKIKDMFDTIPANSQTRKQMEDYLLSKSKSDLRSAFVDSMWIIKDENRRKSSIRKKDRDVSSTDFWITCKEDKSDKEFKEPQNIDQLKEWKNSGISTTFNEGTGSFTADGKMMFFSICEDPKGYGSCDIAITKLENNEWIKPIILDLNVNSKDWDAQPTISPYNRRLFFTSTRPGPNSDGKAASVNMDIWYSDWDSETNAWLPAKNLTEINSPGVDCAPYIAPDGVTLFFSSSGHKPNFGGLDYFVTKYNPTNDSWSKPVNLGKPINTELDDMFISVPASGEVIYFSSKRKDIEGYQGGLDLYMAYVPDYNSDETCSNSNGMVINLYPNPFSDIINISYTLEEASNVRIQVLRVSGEEIAVLKDAIEIKGNYKTQWNGKNSFGMIEPSGLYFLKFTIEVNNSKIEIFKKIMLMR